MKFKVGNKVCVSERAIIEEGLFDYNGLIGEVVALYGKSKYPVGVVFEAFGGVHVFKENELEVSK